MVQAYRTWEARYAIAWGIDTFNDLEHTGMSNLLSRVGIKPDTPEDAETAAPPQQSDKESHSNALIWALSGIALLAVGGFAAFQLKKRKVS